MTESATAKPAVGGMRFRNAAQYLLICGAVWLGWEVVKAPIVARVTPALALRLAPFSPETLRRAAESEFQANRVDNALRLAEASLSRAPFNARAMRVRGLAEARLGDQRRADEMLTLAGNWSLRDDPAHAWLFDHRLRRGNYASAFAHADTLVRRRTDLYPTVFQVFATAAAHDPRAMGALVKLLSDEPPWRAAFLDFLYQEEARAPVVMTLAVALRTTSAPFSQSERERLYDSWVRARRFAGLRPLRTYMGPDINGPPLQNGDFETALDQQVLPFGWNFNTGVGMTSSLVEDDNDADNMVYRLDYDGFSPGVFVTQLVLLEPGSYVLTGLVRAGRTGDTHMQWRVQCAETDINLPDGGDVASPQDWTEFNIAFTVPSENCSAQWVRLAADPGDVRTSITASFDRIEIHRSQKSQ